VPLDLMSQGSNPNFFNTEHTLAQRIRWVHDLIKQKIPKVNRIAVAVYDEKTDVLKTFVHSTDIENPLPLYECKLSDAPALLAISQSGKPRVINQMSDLPLDKQHTQRVRSAGFQSSFTQAIYHNERFSGFIFFNSLHPGAFTEEYQQDLSIMAYLVNLLINNEFNVLTTLNGVVHSLEDVAQFRDEETGYHLERMSRYSRVIARYIAQQTGLLSDEHVEYIFLYSTLHDIGKIAIPDNILLKPGKLTEGEMTLMKSHPSKGHEIIKRILDNLSMKTVPFADALLNIILCHHERWDGMGYPAGLSGDAIPIEARVVAVADVFDALTSARSYKEAWSIERAFEFIEEKSGSFFDPNCVQALLACEDDIRLIKDQFAETGSG
jgi:two-component system, response regulator RpfG